jgi:hypothetical protein
VFAHRLLPIGPFVVQTAFVDCLSNHRPVAFLQFTNLPQCVLPSASPFIRATPRKNNTKAVQLMHIVCDRFLDPSKHEAHCAATPLKNTPVRTRCAYFLAIFNPLTRHLHSEATCSQKVLPSQTLAFDPITSPKTV